MCSLNLTAHQQLHRYTLMLLLSLLLDSVLIFNSINMSRALTHYLVPLYSTKLIKHQQWHVGSLKKIYIYFSDWEKQRATSVFLIWALLNYSFLHNWKIVLPLLLKQKGFTSRLSSPLNSSRHFSVAQLAQCFTEIKQAPHCRYFPPARNVFYCTKVQLCKSNGTEKALSADHRTKNKTKKKNTRDCDNTNIPVLLACWCGCSMLPHSDLWHFIFFLNHSASLFSCMSNVSPNTNFYPSTIYTHFFLFGTTYCSGHQPLTSSSRSWFPWFPRIRNSNSLSLDANLMNLSLPCGLQSFPQSLEF